LLLSTAIKTWKEKLNSRDKGRATLTGAAREDEKKGKRDYRKTPLKKSERPGVPEKEEKQVELVLTVKGRALNQHGEKSGKGGRTWRKEIADKKDRGGGVRTAPDKLPH